MVLYGGVGARCIHRHRRDDAPVGGVELEEPVPLRLEKADRVDAIRSGIDHGRAGDADGIDVTTRQRRRGDRLPEMTLPNDRSVGHVQRVHGVVFGGDDHPVADHEGLRVNVSVESRRCPLAARICGRRRTIGRESGARVVAEVRRPVRPGCLGRDRTAAPRRNRERGTDSLGVVDEAADRGELDEHAPSRPTTSPTTTRPAVRMDPVYPEEHRSIRRSRESPVTEASRARALDDGRADPARDGVRRNGREVPEHLVRCRVSRQRFFLTPTSGAPPVRLRPLPAT